VYEDTWSLDLIYSTLHAGIILYTALYKLTHQGAWLEWHLTAINTIQAQEMKVKWMKLPGDELNTA